MIELGVLTRAGWLLVAQVVDGKVVDQPFTDEIPPEPPVVRTLAPVVSPSPSE